MHRFKMANSKSYHLCFHSPGKKCPFGVGQLREYLAFHTVKLGIAKCCTTWQQTHAKANLDRQKQRCVALKGIPV